MEIKKFFEFFDFNKEEDKLSDQNEMAKEILSSIDMFIDIIDDEEDIKKLKEIEKILEKYK